MFREGSQIGLYTLIRKLGRGGFGEVWLAERRAKFVTTKVAVKLPHEEQIDPEAIKQEATLWEQASGHPNILPIIDADEYDGQIVIVSEFAPDGSLDEWLKRNGKMSVERAIETTIKILDGLEFLHSRHIIHRDLKPANILLQGNTPRLADFGISRAMRTTVASQSQNISGTFAYMSPEALDGKRSIQTDIWSVGVNLYQFLTGTLPFPQKEPSVLFPAIIMREFAPLHDSIPQSLKNVVAKALAKLPENRYASSGAMREDLKKVLVNVQFPQFVPKEILPKVSLLETIAAPVTIESETVISKAKISEKLVEEQHQREEADKKAFLYSPIIVLAEQHQHEAEMRQKAIERQRLRAEEAEHQEETKHSNQEETKRRRAERKRLRVEAEEKKRKATKKTAIGIGIGAIAVMILGVLIWAVSSNLPSNVANNNTASTTSSNLPTFKNSIGMEFVKIPSGSFMMGSDKNDDEKPIHKVTISQNFWLQTTEVTQPQWQAVMGNNPSNFKGDNLPVETVSWEDAQEFIKKLNAKGEGTYRLPTEAEWEYAARAGTTGNYAGNLDSMAWYSANSGSKTHEVGTKQTNSWRLYDMHGNVWEWCQDWYGEYPSGAVTNPAGATTGSNRVYRGGSFINGAVNLHSAIRYHNSPSLRNPYLGFRVVRN